MAQSYRSALADILTKQNLSESRLARIIGIKQQSLYQRIHGNRSINLSSLIEILNVLNYDVVLVPRGERIPNHSYVIEDGEK